MQHTLPSFNRRLGPDVRLRAVTWITILGWVLVVVLFVFLHLARPEVATLFTRMEGIEVRSFWHPVWGKVALNLGWSLLLVATGGVLLNATRMRRRRDHLNTGIVLLLFLATGVTLMLLFAL